MNKNGGKNGVTNNKATQFTSKYQPSPEAKKTGWERRREAQKILDELMKQGDMSYKDFLDLLEDIKQNPQNHTLREVKVAKYLRSEKHTIDWLNKHISNAPQEVDLTSKKGITKYTFEIVNAKQGDNAIQNP